MSSKINALANLRYVSCPLRLYYLNINKKTSMNSIICKKKAIFIVIFQRLNKLFKNWAIKYKPNNLRGIWLKSKVICRLIHRISGENMTDMSF